MNIRTELMETLIRQCVREVLDQVDERVDSTGKPIDKSSGIGKGSDPKKLKPKWMKPTKFTVKPKVVKEEEEQNPEDPKDQPAEPSPAPSSQPEPQANEPQNPAEPKTDEPNMDKSSEPENPEVPQKATKGPQFVNPRDKSKLSPVKISGRDDTSIERSLHQMATSVAGARAKVSLGAKRIAREITKNPDTSVFFYLGKMDPESEEIFLMADKSLNIAKDDSVQPGDLTGAPVTSLPPAYKSFGNMDDNEYSTYMKGRNLPKPRHGIDEGASQMIKKMVNQILDGKK